MHAEPSVVLGVAVIVASAPSLAGWSVGHSIAGVQRVLVEKEHAPSALSALLMGKICRHIPA